MMTGRKSGKGIFVYEGKNRDENEAAMEILKKYAITPSTVSVNLTLLVYFFLYLHLYIF